jgi:hypothetical protein
VQALPYQLFRKVFSYLDLLFLPTIFRVSKVRK